MGRFFPAAIKSDIRSREECAARIWGPPGSIPALWASKRAPQAPFISHQPDTPHPMPQQTWTEVCDSLGELRKDSVSMKREPRPRYTPIGKDIWEPTPVAKHSFAGTFAGAGTQTTFSLNLFSFDYFSERPRLMVWMPSCLSQPLEERIQLKQSKLEVEIEDENDYPEYSQFNEETLLPPFLRAGAADAHDMDLGVPSEVLESVEPHLSSEPDLKEVVSDDTEILASLLPDVKCNGTRTPTPSKVQIDLSE